MPKKSNTGKGNVFRPSVGELLIHAYLKEPQRFAHETLPEMVAGALNDAAVPLFDPKDKGLSPSHLLLDYFRLLDRDGPPYEFSEHVERAVLANSELSSAGVLILLMLSRKAGRHPGTILLQRAVAHYCLSSIDIIKDLTSPHPVVVKDLREQRPFNNLLVHVSKIGDEHTAELSVDAKSLGLAIAKDLGIPNARHSWINGDLPSASMTIAIDDLLREPVLKRNGHAQSIARFYEHAPCAAELALEFIARKPSKRLDAALIAKLKQLRL